MRDYGTVKKLNPVEIAAKALTAESARNVDLAPLTPEKDFTWRSTDDFENFKDGGDRLYEHH